jgi:hypothetical protein
MNTDGASGGRITPVLIPGRSLRVQSLRSRKIWKLQRTVDPISILAPNSRVMRRKFVLLLFSALAATPAFADEMIWSPNHSKALIVDTSGRCDALDAWKPELSESQVGKIVLPSFVAAKWISENDVLIDLESGFTETKNFDSFRLLFKSFSQWRRKDAQHQV